MTVLVYKPFSDDLSVGLHQVIGDVSASQVLQRVCSTDLDLHTHNKVQRYLLAMLGVEVEVQT